MRLTEIRIRSQISEAALAEMSGQNLSDDEYAVTLNRSSRVVKPNGELLCVYLKGVLSEELLEASYPALHDLRGAFTQNRGLASGTKRVQQYAGARTYAKPVASGIVGAFDAKPPYSFCRLTSWTGLETEKFQSLWPLFGAIAEQFKVHVPDRYENQMQFVGQTHKDWVIPGTVFSTVTVNNTWATGVHVDKGDLKKGFGNLAVLRRGKYSGGRLVFPKFEVSVDLQHGDLLLMDVHEAHGNTALHLESEDAERISVVCYVREKIKNCGSAQEEAERAMAVSAARTAHD